MVLVGGRVSRGSDDAEALTAGEVVIEKVWRASWWRWQCW